MENPAARQKLDSLQGWRGVAAMLVVFYHAAEALSSDKYGARSVFGGFFTWGHAGVQFFFVLSGFIIFWAHRRDVGLPEAFGRYAMRRFVRIYPIYWAVLLPLVALYFLVPSLQPGDLTSPSAIAASIFLVGPLTPVLSVAWTLFHEVLFYALFGVAILNRRLGVALMGLWFAGSLLGIGYALSHLNLLFLAGMAAAWTCQRPSVLSGRGLMTVGVVGFVLVGAAEWQGYFDRNDSPSTLLYGIAAFLLVIGSVRAESAGQLRVPPMMTFLGDASYSLYLVHYPVIALVAKLTMGAPVYAVFAMMVAAATAAGSGFHLMVERPLLKAASGLRVRPSPRPLAASPEGR